MRLPAAVNAASNPIPHANHGYNIALFITLLALQGTRMIGHSAETVSDSAGARVESSWHGLVSMAAAQAAPQANTAAIIKPRRMTFSLPAARPAAATPKWTPTSARLQASIIFEFPPHAVSQMFFMSIPFIHERLSVFHAELLCRRPSRPTLLPQTSEKHRRPLAHRGIGARHRSLRKSACQKPRHTPVTLADRLPRGRRRGRTAPRWPACPGCNRQ